jgi:hypothetical protein
MGDPLRGRQSGYVCLAYASFSGALLTHKLYAVKDDPAEIRNDYTTRVKQERAAICEGGPLFEVHAPSKSYCTRGSGSCPSLASLVATYARSDRCTP